MTGTKDTRAKCQERQEAKTEKEKERKENERKKGRTKNSIRVDPVTRK